MSARRVSNPEEEEFRVLRDPKFLASHSAAEVAAIRERRAAYMAMREAPLVQALRDVGEDVSTVYDLVNGSYRYQSAIPVLVAHLPKDYPARIREGIARALATPAASDHWSLLRQLYKEEDDFGAQQGLACALKANATPARVQELIDLVRDVSRGDSRGLLLSAIVEYGTPSEIDQVLTSLSEDEVLGREAKRLLRRRARSHGPERG